jgi:hypothetical protein
MITTNPPAASSDKYAEAGDDIYEKFSHHRKMVIVAVVSFCACLSQSHRQAVLSAVPEVAATYSTERICH